MDIKPLEEIKTWERPLQKGLFHHLMTHFAWLLDRFHSIYCIGRKTSWRIYVVRVRLTRKQLTSRPDHLWPELWKSMGKHAKLKEKQKWSEEKIHLENARKLRGIYFIDPEDTEFKETIKNARKKLETSVAPVLQSGLDENWWADSMECYCKLRNIQDRLSDGKTPNDVLVNHLRDRSFHLVLWWNIIVYPRKISHESINLERKCSVESSMTMYCTRGESGKETSWSRILRSWKIWTHQKSMLKDSMQKRWCCLKVVKNSFYQSQMEQ